MSLLFPLKRVMMVAAITINNLTSHYARIVWFMTIIGRADPYLSIKGLSIGELGSNWLVREVPTTVTSQVGRGSQIVPRNGRLRCTDYHTEYHGDRVIDNHDDCDTDYQTHVGNSGGRR
jgi:hypothetical protein